MVSAERDPGPAPHEPSEGEESSKSNAPTKMVSARALGQAKWTASVRRLAPHSFRCHPAARVLRHSVGLQSPPNHARRVSDVTPVQGDIGSYEDGWGLTG